MNEYLATRRQRWWSEKNKKNLCVQRAVRPLCHNFRYSAADIIFSTYFESSMQGKQELFAAYVLLIFLVQRNLFVK